MKKLQKFRIAPYTLMPYNGYAIHYMRRYFIQPYFDTNSVLYQENTKDGRINFKFDKTLKNKKLAEIVKHVNRKIDNKEW